MVASRASDRHVGVLGLCLASYRHPADRNVYVTTWDDPGDDLQIDDTPTSPSAGVKGMPGYKKGQITGTRRGRDGQPVMFTGEPLIDDQDIWDQLQEAIKADSRARGQAQSRHLLYRVLFCRSCSPKPPCVPRGSRHPGARSSS
jgi:hypothetical protein